MLLLLTLINCRQGEEQRTATLPEGHVTLTFPNESWKTSFTRHDKEVVTYKFERGYSSDQRLNHAELFVYITNLTGENPRSKSVWPIFEPRNDYKIEGKFNRFLAKAGFTNVSAYKTETGYMMHAIKKDKGFQFMFASFDDVSEEINDEFEYIIESIRFY